MVAPLELKTPWRQALRLNGINQFVSLSMPAAGIPEHWSVAYFGFWAKPTGAPDGCIIGDSIAGGGNAIDISFPWTTDLKWQFGGLDGADTLNVTWNAAWDSVWAWWEFTAVENGIQQAFRNGTLLGSRGSAFWYNTHGNAALFVGKLGGVNFWRGAVRNLIVATTIPTDSQREQYKNGWVPNGAGVNMFLPFEGNTTAKIGPNGGASGGPDWTWQPPQTIAP
jgi:hypothetical protein